MFETKSRLTNIGLILFAAMVVGAVASRFLIEIPNFKPVAALAMLSGLMFANRKLAIAVPLASMAISDCFFGFAEPLVTGAVYIALAINTLIGQRLHSAWQQEHRLGNRLGLSLTASLTGTLQFFVITNLVVWGGTAWYPKTIAGFVACFQAAVPFLRFSLAADLLFGWLPLACLAMLIACYPSLGRTEKAIVE